MNKTQQRWLALGILFSMIVVLAAAIFIPWYSSLNETLDDIDEQIFRIKRYQKIIASREEVLSKVEHGREEINALGYIYTQGTSSLAAAELQKRLKEIVQRAEGELTSTQVLPNKTQDNLVRIAVKLKLTGDMEMLKSLLYEIDLEKPLINIDEISIIPKRGKRNRKTRKIEESGELTVTLEVSSYMKDKTNDTN